MTSLIKKTIKGHAYYYLVESGRVNGKPRIIRQQYLGTLENIAAAVSNKDGEIPTPEFSTVLEFGAVCALFDIAERLGIRTMIDAVAGKRSQGLPVSDTLLLAAINRAVMPESKNAFYSWFRKTVLHNCFPLANEKNLSSQGFWNNMSLLDETKIQEIEDNITHAVVQKYDIPTECLLFDNTNFFTYIDTNTPASLPKRGKSKEHRSDLKIVGLSMMVSPDHSIPLFHETYPGNTNDAKQFGKIIDRLKARYRKLGNGECKLTLVFDKGNNSEDNIDAIMDGVNGFDFVGGLRFNQCPEFNSISKDKFIKLKGDRLEKTSAYRRTKEIYGRKLAVLLTFNQELYDAQIDGVIANIAKCKEKLQLVEERLEARSVNKITKGRSPTVSSVRKAIANILSAEHMKKLFDCEVFADPVSHAVILRHSFNDKNFEMLKAKRLGRSILFTSHTEWSTEKIVSVYRSQYHIEDAFRRMKDTQYLSFRPVRHFTDSNIRVHAFYCVLALLLTSLLNRELEEIGHKSSIHKMLDNFQSVQQVITYFPSNAKKQRCVYSFSGLEDHSLEYIKKYDLTKYALQAG
jgi:transposase